MKQMIIQATSFLLKNYYLPPSTCFILNYQYFKKYSNSNYVAVIELYKILNVSQQ